MSMWVARLEGGPKRVNHAAAAVDYEIFSFGGYCSGFDFEKPSPMDVHVFNTLTLKWKKLPTSNDLASTPYRRYGHSAVAKDYYIYIWGGRDDSNGACNTLYRYDTRINTWNKPRVSGKIPGPRDGHSACVVGDSMYIFAGFEERTERFCQTIFKLNLNAFIWEQVVIIGQPASFRDFHTASVLHDRYMLIFGGRCDSSIGPSQEYREYYCSLIYCFDTVDRIWSTLEANGRPVIGRRSHSAFVYQNRLYIFGGYNSLVRQHMKDLLCFNPVDKTWRDVGKTSLGLKGPCKRRRQAACVVGSKVYIFGGTSPTDSIDKQNLQPILIDHDDLWIFDFQPSLKLFAIHVINQYKLDITFLPKILKDEIESLRVKSNKRNLTECGTHG